MPRHAHCVVGQNTLIIRRLCRLAGFTAYKISYSTILNAGSSVQLSLILSQTKDFRHSIGLLEEAVGILDYCIIMHCYCCRTIGLAHTSMGGSSISTLGGVGEGRGFLRPWLQHDKTLR